MKDVEIFEREFEIDNKKVKIAILRGGLKSGNPTAALNEAVDEYVGAQSYNEFVEAHLDNPWVRVVLSGIDELDFKSFEDQKL